MRLHHSPHDQAWRSEEHTSELQSHVNLVCRLLPEKKKSHPGPTLRTATSRSTPPASCSCSAPIIRQRPSAASDAPTWLCCWQQLLAPPATPSFPLPDTLPI